MPSLLAGKMVRESQEMRYLHYVPGGRYGSFDGAGRLPMGNTAIQRSQAREKHANNTRKQHHTNDI